MGGAVVLSLRLSSQVVRGHEGGNGALSATLGAGMFGDDASSIHSLSDIRCALSLHVLYSCIAPPAPLVHCIINTAMRSAPSPVLALPR